MNHPDPSDLLDHRRGELSEDQAKEIEFHLELCDECRSEWEAFDGLEQRLTVWVPEDTRGGAAAAVMRRLDREAILPQNRRLAGTGHRAETRPLPRWVRQLTVAAAAVAASLIFQAMVWNPLGDPAPFRAIVSLTSPAYAMTSSEAVPDTILVLTIHHDETYSTPALSGRFEVDDLTDELIEITEPGAYTEIRIVGADPDHPVTIRTNDLERLTETLKIDTVTYGEGIVAIERVRDEIRAHIHLPIERVRTDLQVRRVLSDSLRRAIALEVRADSINVIALVSHDSLSARAINIRMTPQRLRVEPRVRVGVETAIEEQPYVVVRVDTTSAVIEPARIVLHIHETALEAMHDSLTVPIQAVLTVDEAGLVLMNRAAVPIAEVTDVLRRLKEQNPGIALLILIPEGSDEDDPGYVLVKIARDLGIEKVTVRKVKK